MMARATVIIPTFGEARFAVWAIKSVQQQTVQDLEICIICDGSPPEMVDIFNQLAARDLRIQVFVFPKAPRTGEPYRDIVIRQTSGRIICYCSHDDLWLPYHVESMEKTLQRYSFTHSLHALTNLPQFIKNSQNLLGTVLWVKLSRSIIRRMQSGENFFGLTFGAHTRECYYQLKEGWVTTPIPDMPTDLYMWRKFLTAFGDRSQTVMRITALNFRKIDRKDWSEKERETELKEYFKKISSPSFLRQIYYESLRFCPAGDRTRYFLNNLSLWLPPAIFKTKPSNSLIME
jgi:glycosyltransferase involved in cell wall biosynthesis